MTAALIISADASFRPGIPRNLGDAFLTEALAAAIRQGGWEARIADFGLSASEAGAPEHDRVPLADDKVGGLSRAIQRSDAVVVGGGTLLQDNEPRGPVLGGMARLLVLTSVLARRHRTPLVFFGVGANPVSRSPQKAMIRGSLWRNPVWVRDSWTQDLLSTAYGKMSTIAADTALLAEGLPREGSGAGSEIGLGAVLAGYPLDAGALETEQVRDYRARFGSVSFVSMSQGERGDASYLSAPVRQELDEVHENVPLTTAVDVVGGASAVVSSRMHGLYLGLLQDKLLLALGSRHKVTSFAEEFRAPRIQHWAQIAEVAPERGSSSALCDARSRVKAALNDALPAVD